MNTLHTLRRLRSPSVQTYEIIDNHAEYAAKKKEVLEGKDAVGTRIVHLTANQEGCECATLTMNDTTRTLTITRYDDIVMT